MSKLIHYFSSCPGTFGFQASSQLDDITLNAANKKADQRLSFSRLALVQLLMPLWIQSSLFLITGLPLLILLPLQGSDGDIIADLEVNELLIHDILDIAVSKWVGNTACILAYLFLFKLPHSIVKSGLHSFSSFTISRTLSPNVVCLYGCTNCYLADV